MAEQERTGHHESGTIFDLPVYTAEQMRRTDAAAIKGAGSKVAYVRWDIREPAPADFHRQVAARDHQPERPAAGAVNDDFRQIGHRAPGFDLGDAAQIAGAAHFQFFA